MTTRKQASSEPFRLPKSWTSESVARFDLSGREGRAQGASLLAGRGSPPLSAFVEATTNFRLDAWQLHLCERLERLGEERGARLLIHAPPQAGKSILVSQRFPAWLLGVSPKARIKLACYNETHAIGFSRIVRDLMLGREFARLFPAWGSRLPSVSAQEEWSTLARLRERDGQASLKALGLLTGFVGQGADCLVVDDPYASPNAAISVAVRESVWMFWAEAAKVRLHADTNVVVMFHRYHEDDLAGRLMREEGLVSEGGRWELLRYAAVAEGDIADPDPIGREVGEPLCTRWKADWLADQQKNALVWLGQFQGRPSARTGGFFEVERCDIVDAIPLGLPQRRAWDLAATEGGGDFTAGVKVAGPDAEGYFYVVDVVRGQWGTARRNAVVRQTAELDGVECGVRGAQDPGAAGVDMARAFRHLLMGFRVEVLPVSGAKETRADPLSAQMNAGSVRVLRGGWNRDFLEELRGFPRGKHDDQVDATADAFNALAMRRKGRGA